MEKVIITKAEMEKDIIHAIKHPARTPRWLYFVGYAVLLLAIPDLHLIVKLLLAIIPLVMAGYALWAAKERIEEIKGGEEDDLSQY